MKKILKGFFQANGKRLKCCPASVLRQAQGVVRSGGDLVYVEGRQGRIEEKGSGEEGQEEGLSAREEILCM
jgi:hypothetical protein